MKAKRDWAENPPAVGVQWWTKQRQSPEDYGARNAHDEKSTPALGCRQIRTKDTCRWQGSATADSRGQCPPHYPHLDGTPSRGKGVGVVGFRGGRANAKSGERAAGVTP